MSKFSLLGYYINKCRRARVSTNQRPVQPCWFSDWPEREKEGDLTQSYDKTPYTNRKFENQRTTKNTNLLEDIEILLPVNFIKFLSAVSEEKPKMSQQIRGNGGHLVFPIGPKNTNLIKDLKILLPVEFLPIRFSGFRGEVNNVSANQRPGRPSWFSDRPEKHKLGRAHWDLASCQVS